MAKIELNTKAPEFKLENYRGQEIRLSDFKEKKNVLVVLNRGFM